MKQVKVGIIGASGYGGAELVRLLLAHPYAKLVAIHARSFIGQPISDVYPNFYELYEGIFESEDSVIEKSDIIFASLPHGLSEVIAKKIIEQKKKMIDLGADFRLDDEATYEAWYNKPFTYPTLHEKCVYGLSEYNREKIKQAQIIANPGCYPTSVALGLLPFLKHHTINQKHIIIDSKSGTTGAGKELSEKCHFPNCNEGFAPYNVAKHRHTPEIEQTLTQLSGQNISVTFVPHLLAINRGIISTMYITLDQTIPIETLHTQYKQYYASHPFVRILALSQCANLKYVKQSNYCDISLHMDTRSNMLIIVSCIDNMVKGAAGQAIQNMNILCDFEETSGLTQIPPAF